MCDSFIPNMVYLAPTSKEEYFAMLNWSIEQNEHPVAIRIPCNGVISDRRKIDTNYSNLNKFKVEIKGENVAIIALGDFYQLGENVIEELKNKIGLNATLINPQYITGIDSELLKKLKENHDILLGICGCMAQEESVVNEIMSKYKYVDFVFGTHNLDNMVNVINNSIKTGKQNVEVYSIEGNICEGIPEKRESKYSAWVDIQLGCDKFCTYCIVPYTRGTQRSRKKESIIIEIEKLKSEGYKEVTLLGQNVNAYGKDLYEDYTLANLLIDVAKTNIERIRFVTSHPWDFTDEMIDVISKYDNVMPYVHLPIQSGSDRILKLMGRKYTKEEYLTLYNKIRTKVKGVSITTDIIVGFPGETESDFNETLDVVNTCKFDGAFTFIFSPRVGTPAMKLPDDTPKEEKESRLYKLNELVNKYSLESNLKMVDKIVKCLVVSPSEKDPKKYMGYTENMKLVNIESDKDLIGQIVDVIITEAHSFSLNGKYIES